MKEILIFASGFVICALVLWAFNTAQDQKPDTWEDYGDDEKP